MKHFILVILLFTCFSSAKADHITGGEMFYTMKPGLDGLVGYDITLKLFMRCNSGRQFNDPIIISLFNRGTNARINDYSVPIGRQESIQLADAGPCVSNPPTVCYVIGTYYLSLSLPATAAGYTLASQVNFRISGISNLTPGYSNIGATYTCEIPGINQVANAHENNSAKFIGNDLVVVCANNRFNYSFEAQDADSDLLNYSFCNAYVSGSSGVGNTSAPPPSPPYASVPYGSDFGSGFPLGLTVNIDSKTGLITGNAPATGVYVVTVCVEEIRNGKVIATQRKDLQINIASCDIAAASLTPEYMLCRDTKALSVSNQSTSSLIKTQNWEIFNQSGIKVFDSTGNYGRYTFTDTGIYKIRLTINRNQACTDSAESIVRVYPGFLPSFNFSGLCFTKPTQFTNTSSTVYGAINSWQWKFVDLNGADTSRQYNPVYTYGFMGPKVALLTLSNTNGCRDTAMRTVNIFDKPPLNLAFSDTLICVNDSVQIIAKGNGLYQWSPNTNLVNSNTASPIVSPVKTTRYYVDLNDEGCLNRDSVLVRVVDKVTLKTMADTVICQGDPIFLRVVSDGFKYSWTPAMNLENPLVAAPKATTNNKTIYEVTASIGGCSAKDQVTVTPVPYPKTFAGADTTICFNTTARLIGVNDGSSFTWSSTQYLSNPNSLVTVAQPSQTTTFILSGYDVKGCPKPGIDSIQVVVLPDIKADAGNDTSIVIGQKLQLNATGGLSYSWQPFTGLSNPGIGNPVALYSEASEGMRYIVFVYNQAGCVDTASINIKVYATNPSVFVPTAFTPNKDGKNDVLRPIAAGIKTLEYFNVYNRWGHLVFSTTQNGKGWDGTVSGNPQGTGTFVWVVKATDYNNTPYLQKGTVTLIR